LRTVVVDGANVMGSRPDGWWRDRAGAATRLYADLSRIAQPDMSDTAAASDTADTSDTEFVLVLEGAARAAKIPPDGVVRVVLAPGSGDDTIAALAGSGTLVVTADRELRRRCEQRGAEVVGPGWLLGKFRGLPERLPSA
jgi:8-oxo-dGTP diphosphatase